MSNGILAIVSGFSGAGKGTMMKRLLEKYENEYVLSISATTRSPRANEQNGREYYFKTKEEFLKMIDENELLEYAQYVDNYYGTPRAYVEEQLQAGKNVILEIEIQGALQIKNKFPKAVSVFVTPPSAEELARRLTERGTETAEVIASRLKRAAEEADYLCDYDHMLINDVLEESVDHLHQIIVSAREHLDEKEMMAAKMKQELCK